MFYIDFTSPEDKTYLIDVSKNPVTYECPVCGEKNIYTFDPNEVEYCSPCNKLLEEKRISDFHRRLKICDKLNMEYDLYLNPSDLERLENSPEYKKNPEETFESYIDKRVIDRIKEKRHSGEISSQIEVLFKGRAY